MSKKSDRFSPSAPEPGAFFDPEEPIIQEIPHGEATLPPPPEPAPIRLERLREKARNLPSSPGVYLMKDSREVVIYVGQSRSLRARVGGYFVPSADLGPAKQRLLDYVSDFDTLECDSEVEALLIENRLIKDIKPRFNARLTDGKSYPYLEITTCDDYPGVYITRQPHESGAKLYGPFTSGYALKAALIHLQRAFKFRTCRLEILEDDPKKRYFRPCLLHYLKQCSAPCADKISRQAYREDLERLKRFLDSSRGNALREMTREMEAAAAALDFERAAMLRDQIRALRALAQRGRGGRSLQPEVFFHDHQAGLKQLQEVLELDEPVRSIEAIDIAHFQGEAAVGALVCFIDGKPFKNGYRRFRIKGAPGMDDYKCIQEVITRRYRDAGVSRQLYPDVILIDGGLGQLHAALAAFSPMDVKPPMVVSLAKRQEEIFVQNRSLPYKLPRTNPALKLLQFARDEAHRFARNYHHLLIARRQFAQSLKTGRITPRQAHRCSKSRRQKGTPPTAAPPTELKALSVEDIRKMVKRKTIGPRKRREPTTEQ